MSSTHHNYDERNSKGRVVGWVATVLAHGALLCWSLSVWITRFPPETTPPLEMEILMASEEQKPQVVETPVLRPSRSTVGNARPSTQPPVRAAESTIDNTGDVEVPTPEAPAVDARSLYQSRDHGAEEASATADEANDARALYKGSAEGQEGGSQDAPSFSLSGRSVHGQLGQPENTSNKEGRVVVAITVDQLGKVIQAKARAQGSTVQDATLWRAAEKAAMETLFNVDHNAAALQAGTITYIFRLR